MNRKVVGYAHADKAETLIQVDDKGRVALIRRETHYTAELVEEPLGAAAPADPMDALLKQLETDCRRWYHILQRCPLPGDYISLKRSGQAARWFDVAYEKGIDRAPIKVTKRDGRVEIQHEAPRSRPFGVSAEELSWMDRMMDALLTLKHGSIEWVLVTGRAMRRPWAEIAKLDTLRRQERQLRNLYREALINLLPVWLARVHKI